MANRLSDMRPWDRKRKPGPAAELTWQAHQPIGRGRAASSLPGCRSSVRRIELGGVAFGQKFSRAPNCTWNELGIVDVDPMPPRYPVGWL